MDQVFGAALRDKTGEQVQTEAFAAVARLTELLNPNDGGARGNSIYLKALENQVHLANWHPQCAPDSEGILSSESYSRLRSALSAGASLYDAADVAERYELPVASALREVQQRFLDDQILPKLRAFLSEQSTPTERAQS